MLGLIVAVIVRELCIASDAEDFHGNVSCGEKVPNVQFLKASCSILTAFQVYLMLKQIKLKTEHADTQKSLRSRSRGVLLHNSRVQVPVLLSECSIVTVQAPFSHSKCSDFWS